MRHTFEKDNMLVAFNTAKFNLDHALTAGSEGGFAIRREHILTINKYGSIKVNSQDEVVWKICDATSSYYVYVHGMDTIQKLIKYIEGYDYSSLE